MIDIEIVCVCVRVCVRERDERFIIDFVIITVLLTFRTRSFSFAQTSSYPSLARLMLRSGREDVAKAMFEQALEAAQGKEEGGQSAWLFGVGLAHSVSEQHKDGWETMRESFMAAEDSRKKSKSYSEYRVLASAISKLQFCPNVDEVLDDQVQLLHLLRKHNRASGIFPDTFLLPAEWKAFAKANKEIDDAESKRWVVKPRYSSNGVGVVVAEGMAEVGRLTRGIGGLPANSTHFVVSSYIDNPFLYDGRAADLKLYAMLSGTWPLSRVYINRRSSLVRSNPAPSSSSFSSSHALPPSLSKVEPPGATFASWATSLLSPPSEYQSQTANALAEGILTTTRTANFDSIWQALSTNVGGVLRLAVQEVQAANAARAVLKKDDKKMAAWKKVYLEGRHCRNKLYAFDAILAGAAADPLLKGGAKGWLLDASSVPSVGDDWGGGAATEAKAGRVKDTMTMIGGWLADRGALEAVMRKVADPDDIDVKVSQRLSWSVQEITRVFCPKMYKQKTEANRGRGVGDEESCDNEKLGFFAMELSLATLEYERRGGWELAFPLQTENVKEEGESEQEEEMGSKKKKKKLEGWEEVNEDLEREAALMRNLFVKWVSTNGL